MVRRYCSLYFLVLLIFVGCIVGPAVASSHFKDIGSDLNGTFHNLVQPRNQSKNDTGTKMSTYKSHYYTHTPSLKTWSTIK